ncbi:MAG TPA: hypothetical protein VG269_02945 [Tepidisphaeraceae bacterium]|jgi:hypothetical protein|nr:hypothetical protein [Tepidisphaeraceae bacterium]
MSFLAWRARFWKGGSAAALDGMSFTPIEDSPDWRLLDYHRRAWDTTNRKIRRAEVPNERPSASLRPPADYTGRVF